MLSAIVFFNLELGQTICRAGDDRGVVLQVSDDAPYAWLSLKTGVVVVNLQEGKVTFDVRSLPFKPKPAVGGRLTYW